MTKIHVITLNQGKDLFDIYHCAFFKQKVLRKQPLCIVGLAGSRDEAVDMVTEILGHIYRETGNTDVKSYFLKPQDKAEIMR